MAGTTNDEELLILSDDTEIGSEFVLEEQIIEDNNTNFANNELISFDSDLSGFEVSTSDSSNEGVLGVQDTLEKDDLVLSLDGMDSTFESELLPSNDLEDTGSTEVEDFGLSMEQDTTTLDNEESVDKEPVDLVEETIESDLFTSEIEEEPVVNQTVGTMTDILDEAIAKFARREDVIASSIASREEHIKSLREQISSLESAVNTDNEEVARLNTEKQSIVKNRKALEKMKETPTTTTK